MLPYVGLYLPDSLHRSPEKANKLSEGPKSPMPEPKSMDWKSPERTPATGKALAEGNSTFSSLATVFKFVEFASSLKEVSSGNAVFVNLIERVKRDEEEAHRLHTSTAITQYYESWPDRKTANEQTLLDVRRALNDIGLYIEDGRSFGDGSGAVGALKNRFEWILGHHQKLLSRQALLVVCHQSLMAAIELLQMVEMSSVYGSRTQIYEAPARPWVQEDEKDILRSPYSRQKWRHSQRNISLPSITVSDHEDKVDIISTDSIPVELPGSTPDDLIDPDNWDLYISPPSEPKRTYEEEVSDQNPSKVTLNSTSVTPTDDLGGAPSTRIDENEAASHSTPTFHAYQTSVDQPSAPRRLRSSSELAPSPLRSSSSSDQINTTSRPRSSSEKLQNASTFPDQTIAFMQSRKSFDDNSIRHGYENRKAHSGSPVKPRASLDQAATLPTLNEKVAYHTQDHQPKQDGSVPLLAKRYRPKAVVVRKPVAKHHSLPSELPYLPHQTSLVSELSRWVLPGTKPDDPKVPIHDAPIENTPSVSLASSPTIPGTPASCPPGIHYHSSDMQAENRAASVPTTPQIRHIPSPTADPGAKDLIPTQSPISNHVLRVSKVDSGFAEEYGISKIENMASNKDTDSYAITQATDPKATLAPESSHASIADDARSIASVSDFTAATSTEYSASLRSQSITPQDPYRPQLHNKVSMISVADEKPLSPIVSLETAGHGSTNMASVQQSSQGRHQGPDQYLYSNQHQTSYQSPQQPQGSPFYHTPQPVQYQPPQFIHYHPPRSIQYQPVQQPQYQPPQHPQYQPVQQIQYQPPQQLQYQPTLQPQHQSTQQLQYLPTQQPQYQSPQQPQYQPPQPAHHQPPQQHQHLSSKPVQYQPQKQSPHQQQLALQPANQSPYQSPLQSQISLVSSANKNPLSPVVSLEAVQQIPNSVAPTQPLSSQAKRRRAHARRMEKAFGDD